MAREFEIGLGSVSYHLNRVLAGECKAVDLVEKIPRRGSIEKVYRLDEDLWDGSAGRSGRGPGRRLRALSPGECFLEAADALDADTFAELDGSAWEWFSVAVDAKAWKRIRKARREFNKEVEAAVEESRAATEGRRTKTREVVVGVAAFPAARPGGSRSTPS